MRTRSLVVAVLLAASVLSPAPAAVAVAVAEAPSSLRLVPFPKHVEVREGAFALDRPLVLEAPAQDAKLLAELLVGELRAAGLRNAAVRIGETAGSLAWRLSPKAGAAVPAGRFRDGAGEEDYHLEVRPDAATCTARGAAGLLHGVQTLCQLVRANRTGDAIPCLEIRDWPSLRWRCFQDDLTRGPSSRLATLEREVAVGSSLKMNLFTYYMEYQYAFSKHPEIGPKDGSLTPEDLRALVAFAARMHVGILGNQQSFGHFAHILKHEKYAHLRETPSILCPVKEESFQLLDDLYSEVAPLLPFPFFNVCCDETWGLGTGPSKELAKKIGVGGVYVRHIRRIHDILKRRYGKRMMMWGDIILKHPDHLSDVPKDTILLTWGYSAAPSFEKQIIPFVKSGFDFFVCPGVSNWSRILPDFGVAAVNIRNFVRDGAAHGAMGMLNTAWEDDGESLNAPKWHGYAWGAECAWNASATSLEDFNRRIGAVLFGEKGEHFGKAIDLLAKTFRLRGMKGMNNRRFWSDDFAPQGNPEAVRRSAESLLALVRPALDHLVRLREEAACNGDLLDAFILGARRMEFIGQRMLDGLAVAKALARAGDIPAADALRSIGKAERLVRKNRDACKAIGKKFAELWLAENKPYALDWTMQRYRKAAAGYDELLKKCTEARRGLKGGKAPGGAEAAGAETPPNILFILADDMGYGDLACQSTDSKIPTPNLDRLARQGIRLTDAHSPSAVCSPTRYATLTGRYAWRTRLKRGVLWCWDPPLIKAGRLTVPSMLKQHGYDTACVGKWHLGMDWPTTDGKPPVGMGKTRKAGSGANVDFTHSIRNGPTTRGFDYYFGTAVPNFPPYCFIENERTVGIPAVPKPDSMFGCPGPMLEGWNLEAILPALGEKAVAYIDAKAGREASSPFRQTKGRPFFLYVPLTAPHTPIAPAAEFRGKSGAGAYGDFVMEVDWTVGRILEALERNKFEKNTLVIFTSDNGSPGRDGTNRSGPINSVRKLGHNPSAHLRGIKADIWEGGHRVPFIARWPGKIPPGSVSDETVCHVDLLATCAAIVGHGLPRDAAEDSYNILPVLLESKRGRPVREATVHHSGGGMFAIRRGKWKFIDGLGSGGWTRGGIQEDKARGIRGQLYDLPADPSEKRNLWAEQKEIVETLQALLEKYRSAGRSAPPAARQQ